MRLDREQIERLRQAMSYCHAALDQLDMAIDNIPVVGDAELHLLHLGLKQMRSKLAHHRDNGVEILGDKSFAAQ